MPVVFTVAALGLLSLGLLQWGWGSPPPEPQIFQPPSTQDAAQSSREPPSGGTQPLPLVPLPSPEGPLAALPAGAAVPQAPSAAPAKPTRKTSFPVLSPKSEEDSDEPVRSKRKRDRSGKGKSARMTSLNRRYCSPDRRILFARPFHTLEWWVR